jgi:hypothetical protein
MKKPINAILYTGFVLLAMCSQSAWAKYGEAEMAVKSALAGAEDIKFHDVYEITPDLRGVSPTPNYKRTFICGYVTYKKENDKAVRARFIYLAHTEDPSFAGNDPLNLEKPDLDYGLRDESNGGRYATVFEFSGWNRQCADAQHPKTFSGVAPKSDD